MRTFKLFSIILLSCFITFITGCSKPPAPYTEEAAVNLTKAMKKVQQPIPKAGANGNDIIKLKINYFRDVYSNAGYDFDKSLVQLNNDLVKDPEYLSKLPASADTARIMFQLMTSLNNLFTEAKVNPKNFLSDDAAKALSEFAARQKALAEKQKADEEKAIIAREEASRAVQEARINIEQEVKNGIFRGIIKRYSFPEPVGTYVLSRDHLASNFFGEINISSFGDPPHHPQILERLNQLIPFSY